MAHHHGEVSPGKSVVWVPNSVWLQLSHDTHGPEGLSAISSTLAAVGSAPGYSAPGWKTLRIVPPHYRNQALKSKQKQKEPREQ